MAPLAASTKSSFRKAAAAEFEKFLARGERIDLRPRGAELSVSVIVVLYNQADLTLRCLRGLEAQRNVVFETIIVDNASSDRTPDLLRRVDGAVIIRNGGNLGFLRAVNGAAPRARGRFILLLNNDAVALPGALAHAARRLAGDGALGAVGARIADASGRLQEAGPIVWRNANGIGFGAGRAPDHPQFRLVREIDYCCGAFLMTPADLFRRLGGFDERFAPAYYEEMDYCFRVRGAGLRCVYDPAISILHYGRASAPSIFWPYRQMLRNRGKFRQKHGAELARRLRPSPANYWRAVRGRPLSPWVLVTAPPRDGTLGEEAHRRAAELANALLDRGFFVTVASAGDRLGFHAGPFGADAAAAGGSSAGNGREPERGGAADFDVIVVVTPKAGDALAGVLALRPARSPPPLVVCDTGGGRQPGEVFAPLCADLARRGLRRIETGDALTIVAAIGAGAAGLNGATRS